MPMNSKNQRTGCALAAGCIENAYTKTVPDTDSVDSPEWHVKQTSATVAPPGHVLISSSFFVPDSGPLRKSGPNRAGELGGFEDAREMGTP